MKSANRHIQSGVFLLHHCTWELVRAVKAHDLETIEDCAQGLNNAEILLRGFAGVITNTSQAILADAELGIFHPDKADEAMREARRRAEQKDTLKTWCEIDPATITGIVLSNSVDEEADPVTTAGVEMAV